MGTELERRRVDTRLPLWSARGLLTAPGVVAEIHADYVRAGAEILTANTFRTHARSLAPAGWADRAAELTAQAVGLAGAAATTSPGDCWVAGSIAPLEDCFSPALTPPDAELAAEHGAMALALAGADVDLILVETMPTIREAIVATSAAAATGRAVMTGFACNATGVLLSGEDLAEAGHRALAAGATGVMVNCMPAEGLWRALARLRELGAPLGAYGNVGHAPTETGWTRVEPLSPDEYVEYARAWQDAGATLLGSCCGTTPAHTRALALFLQDLN